MHTLRAVKSAGVHRPTAQRTRQGRVAARRVAGGGAFQGTSAATHKAAIGTCGGDDVELFAAHCACICGDKNLNVCGSCIAREGPSAVRCDTR